MVSVAQYNNLRPIQLAAFVLMALFAQARNHPAPNNHTATGQCHNNDIVNDGIIGTCTRSSLPPPRGPPRSGPEL